MEQAQSRDHFPKPTRQELFKSLLNSRPPTYFEAVQIMRANYNNIHGKPKDIHEFIESLDDEYQNWPCAIMIVEDYCTGGPGYAGPVAICLWDGCPSFITVLTLDPATYTWQVLEQYGS